MENNEFENPQPTPPAKKTDVNEQPEMSEVATVGNIFFEPERTFKDLKAKPRFIVAGVIIALLVGALTFGINYKVGEKGIRSFIAEQVDKSPQAGSMSAEQKRDAVDMQMTINNYSKFAVPVFVFISFFIGALLYWLGSKAFGGSGSFMQNLSVWIYSGLPPAVLSIIANLIVLALKAPEDIDLATSQRGLLHANPSFFIDGKAHPILATIFSTFDLFAIWGWILAAIGLRVVNRTSSGSAWAIVIIIVLIGLAFRLLGAFFSGNPS